MLLRTFVIAFASVLAFGHFANGARNPLFEGHLKNLGSDSPYRKDKENYGSSRRTDVEIPHTPYFKTPGYLKSKVEFWIKIYSFYSTKQIVIHDRENLAIVYEVINLEDKFGKKKVSDRTRRRYIRNSEKKVAAILTKLHKNKGKATTEKEKRFVEILSSVKIDSKYKKAAKLVRAQLGQADRFREGMERSGRYMTYIRSTLRKYDLPEELAALPHVESSFNYRAYSSAGASGIWQFTRGTGRLFMKVNYAVDERRDPIASTVAAAKLLRQSYEALDSWPLAITSYNHGLGGIKRAKKKHGSNLETIIEKYKSRSFGFASRNFYAEFLAALEVSRNHRRYFGEIKFEPILNFDEVKLPYYVSAKALVHNLGAPTETLKEYNPALRKSVWSGRRHIPKGYIFKAPRGMKQGLLAALASIPAANRRMTQQSDGYYVVRRGDTLSTIARRNRVSLVSLRNENSIWSDKIRIGQKLRLPPSGKSHIPQIRRKRSSPPSPGEEYVVRRGDTLERIARENNVSLKSLFALNSLGPKKAIYPGQKIVLAAANQPIATVASIAPIPISKELAIDQTDPETTAIVPDEPVVIKAANDPVVTAEGEMVTVNGKTLKLRAADFLVESWGDDKGIVTVRTDETLWHYSEWLRVKRKAIEKLNGGKNLKTSMREGARVIIPTTVVSAEDLQRKRLEYHMELLEDFFEAYSVEGEQQLTVKRGKSLWQLCVKENDVPLWLVSLYNPGSDIHSLKPGDNLTIPVVSKKR